MGKPHRFDGPGGIGVAEPPPRKPRRRARLIGWPPSGQGDGDGGDDDGGDDDGGDDGGGGDGDFDPWNGMPRPGTPELAMALALLCICTLFLVFLALCFFFWKTEPGWLPADAPAPPKGLWVSTVLLVGCSAALARALVAHRRAQQRVLLAALRWSAALGVAFLCSQAYLWRSLFVSGRSPSSGFYAAFFYILTGLHAAHIVGGLFFLSKVLEVVRTAPDRLGPETPLRLVGGYWHVMGGIWIVLFGALYFLR